MTPTDHDDSNDPEHDEQVEQIVRGGPRGALTVVGIATAIVVLLWFAFYLLAFLPRGVIH